MENAKIRTDVVLAKSYSFN